MKKLKLEHQKFAGAEVLNRTQLKMVMGGNFAGSLLDECVKECDIEDEECSFDNSIGICTMVVASAGCSPDGIEYVCIPI